MLHHAIQTAAMGAYRAMRVNVWNPQTAEKCIFQQAGFTEIGRMPKAFEHPEEGYLDALMLHRVIDQEDIRLYIRDARDSRLTKSASGDTEGEAAAEGDDDPDATIYPKSQMTDDFRAELGRQARLPTPQRLPPPKVIARIDATTGYVADSWDPVEVCMRLAFILDALFDAPRQAPATPTPASASNAPAPAFAMDADAEPPTAQAEAVAPEPEAYQS